MLGPYLELNSGHKMPQVGFGTWKVAKDICAENVYQAIKAGYRLIDEAGNYGNEVQAGEGIKRALDEGICKREDLFVTSKLWNTFHRKDQVRIAVKKSLEDLGLDYIDLYLIHFPISLKPFPIEKRYPQMWFYDDLDYMVEEPVPYSETWQALEELVQEGLIKSIGCSNIGCAMLRDVISYAKIKPAVLQNEIHPLNTQMKQVRYCQNNNIHITAYSSFGAAGYVEMGADKSFSLLENETI